MILFLVSFILIFTSSYFITSMLKPKENSIGFIYLFLIAFAQIILTFEVLSLFSAIKESWFLLANVVSFTTTLGLWLKLKRPVWKIKKTGLMRRIYNSLKLDKSLRILFIGYCVFILSAVFICIVMPVINADALGYHIARCAFWITQGNLNHFEIADLRNTCLPINSELLYSWVILFFRKDVGIGFFGFFGYLFSIVSIFNILGLMGYCVRKRLWVIFILTSLPSVLIQASTTETDIIIAALTISCVYLFWYSLKNNQKAPVFIASLAYAIAIGTKPTAIIMIPSVGFLLSFLSFKFKNYKNILIFFAFGLINFLIFSSFNYVLNFFDYGNIMGPESFISINKNYFGYKGGISNFIKHIFMFIDFTGFKWGLYLHSHIASIEKAILGMFNAASLPDSPYSLGSYKDIIALTDSTIGSGILGFLVFLPCVLGSMFKFKNKFNKSTYISIFGLTLIINLFVLSFMINYSTFDVRYLVAFIALSSPVLVLSYNIKVKPLKYIIILFSLFYLIIISTNIKARPVFQVFRILNTVHSIGQFRETIAFRNKCNTYGIITYKIKNNFSPKAKILCFTSNTYDIYNLKTLSFQGYTVDFKLLSNINNIDISKYNLILIKDNKQLFYVKKPLKSLDKEISCDYIKLSTLPKPSYLECNLNNAVLTQHYFKLYSAINTISNGKKNIYYIYENSKNPPAKINKKGN